VTCEPLVAPANGSLLLSSDGSKSTATFSCSHGYSLNGAQTLVCAADGMWDKLVPTCGRFKWGMSGLDKFLGMAFGLQFMRLMDIIIMLGYYVPNIK